jgi:PAS domain S-box-containing protein
LPCGASQAKQGPAPTPRSAFGCSEIRNPKSVDILLLGVRAAGFITAAFGLLALLGWVLGFPLLASFGSDIIPMAPSTALLLLLFGVAVVSRAGTSLSRSAFWLNLAAGGLVALIAILLLVLSTLNIHPAIEHFGVPISDLVDGAVIGHMSSVTAFCFLLASASFLASLSRSAIRPWRTVLALGSAGVLLGIGFIFLLAYFFGTPLLYGGTFIPPACNTLLALSMMALALLVLASRTSRAPAPNDRTAWHFFLIFVVLAVGIVTTAYIYYRGHEQAYRGEVERQLSAIADLKVDDLMRWREDYLSDAVIFFKNPSFTTLVRRFFAQPEDADAQRQLLDWLGKCARVDDYDQFRLMDTQAVTRLSQPSGLNPASAPTVRAAAEALRLGRITIQDFYRHDYNQRVYLSIQIPIRDESDGNRPLGVLVLRIDPTKQFYPFIERWPTPSKTAETLLVRREGNEVVFLNELRFQTNTALNLRAPLDRVALPAAQAALGREGIMDGIDYRGETVIAALRTIPDSPWALVARMDRAEVYGPLRERLWQMAVLLFVLLFGTGSALGLIWRQQRVRSLLDQAQSAEALREANQVLEGILSTIPVRVFWKGRNLTYLGCNQAFAHDAGFADPQDIIGKDDYQMGWRDQAEMYRADDRIVIASGHPRLLMEEPQTTPAGDTIWLITSKVPLRDPTGEIRGVLGTYMDITERKRMEEQQQALAEQLRKEQKLAAVGTLACGMGHEINNPIMGIINYAQLIKDRLQGKDEALEEFADEIVIEAERIAGIVRGLSAFATRDTATRAVVPVSEFIDAALSPMRAMLTHDHITLAVDVPEDLPTVSCDRRQIEQVLTSLVSNARDALNEKYPEHDENKKLLITARIVVSSESHVSATEQPQPNTDRRLRLTVEDHGTGIPEAVRSHIFEPFFTTKDKSVGAGSIGKGLGLFVSYAIVQEHGGVLSVESSVGQWTRFDVDLPVGEISER